MSKEFEITQNRTLRYNDNVTTINVENFSFDGVAYIDFNNVEHIQGNLRLDTSDITYVDFKKVITAHNVYLPMHCSIKENFYWVNRIYGAVDQNVENPVFVNSERMHHLKVYESKPLVYLSGTVVGYLPVRRHQRQLLQEAGFGVYSPGNHMTLGDPIADKYPEIVYKIDILAMHKADVIFFDLNNLSAGTCAELGYSIAKGWHKTKELVGIYKPTKNFFINGLVKHIKLYDSLEDYLKYVKYSEFKYD